MILPFLRVRGRHFLCPHPALLRCIAHITLASSKVIAAIRFADVRYNTANIARHDAVVSMSTFNVSNISFTSSTSALL
jgi:hypothetical protein